MDLTQYREMDPNILYSIINMKIRNSRRDLKAVLDDLGLDYEDFVSYMAEHDFHYKEEIRQFR